MISLDFVKRGSLIGFMLLPAANWVEADSEEISLGKIQGWEMLYLPKVERGGTCAAIRTEGDAEHLLAISGTASVWTWFITLPSTTKIVDDGEHPLQFNFDASSSYSVSATVSSSQVTATGLPESLVESIGSAENLVLSLDGHHLKSLEIGADADVISILKTCQQVRILSRLEAFDRLSQADMLRENGELQRSIDELKIVLELKKQALGESHIEIADVLYFVSRNYYLLGMHTEAIGYLESQLAIEKQVLGTDHPQVKDTLEMIANTSVLQLMDERQQSLDKNQFSRVVDLQREILAIVLKTWGPSDPRTIDAQAALGQALTYVHRDEEAELMLSQALALGEAEFGVQDERLLWPRQNLAMHYSETGRFTDADRLLKQNLDMQESLLGTEHPDLLDTIDSLTLVAENQQNYLEALTLALRSLMIRERTLGVSHQDVATNRVWIAGMYVALMRYEEASDQLDRALEIQQETLGLTHPAVAETFETQAELYLRQGRINDALAVQLRGEKILEQHEANIDRNTLAFSYSQTGSLLAAAGRYKEADERFEKALKIFEETTGVSSEGYIQTLLPLAGSYHSQARFEEAERVYKEVIGSRMAELGGERQLATALFNLAILYSTQHHLEEAEPLIARLAHLPGQYLDLRGLIGVWAVYSSGNLTEVTDALGSLQWDENQLKNVLFEIERSSGPDFVDLSMWLELLAIHCMNQSCEHEESESLLKRALHIREAAFGSEHPDVAKSYFIMAEFYRQRERFDESSLHYVRSIQLREEILEPDHPDLAASFNGFASLNQRLGNSALEQDLHRKALRIVKSRMSRGESSTKEREYSYAYVHFLGNLETLSFSDQVDALDATQIARGQAKGEVFRLLGERLLSGGNSPLAELIRQRQDLTRQVSALEIRLIEANSLNAGERREVVERLRGRLDVLRSKEREASERLQQGFPEYAEFEGSRLTSIAELQTALRPREAALAWILGEDTSYLLIVPSEGDLKLRVLNVTEQEVSSSVDALHKALDLGDPDHLGELAPFPTALAFELFGQLFGEHWKDDLKGIDKLVLVPEGPLTRLAFPALLTEQTGFDELPAFSDEYRNAEWLARRFSVSMVPTLSSITVLRNASPEGQAEKPFLGVGDPLLDDHPSKNRGVIDNHEPVEFTTVRNIRDAGDIQPQPANSVDMRRTRLERIRQQPSLPDTAIELQRIAGLLQASNDDLFLREEATEQRIKETTLNQYRLLSFATHGVLAGEMGFGIEPGLILTPPEESTDLDDGFLSMSEIAQLNLNAEWVVLSACNTAGAAANSDSGLGNSGANSVSEGLTGMAKAFTYAGARAMLVSHWSVSSATTVELMENIIRSYSPGKLSRSAAHREAMLAMIESGDLVKSHPSIWAPFIIFGDG